MVITIPLDGVDLRGELVVPDPAIGLVLFAHGSNSSRRSPRNQQVARALQARGLGTLLFDLRTDDEVRQDELDTLIRSDVDYLAERLMDATDWVRRVPTLAPMPVAYFGASTGAAAALIAAARRPTTVTAVVSRGGRPDLAEAWLPRVRTPVLFVVGSADAHVLALNRDARSRLPASELVIVPGAGHLFEEPGALDEVARIAGDWLVAQLRDGAAGSRRAFGDPLC